MVVEMHAIHVGIYAGGICSQNQYTKQSKSNQRRIEQNMIRVIKILPFFYTTSAHLRTFFLSSGAAADPWAWGENAWQLFDDKKKDTNNNRINDFVDGAFILYCRGRSKRGG